MFLLTCLGNHVADTAKNVVFTDATNTAACRQATSQKVFKKDTTAEERTKWTGAPINLK